MNLRRLFVIHAMIVLAAGLVLVVAPAAIPQTVNIHITPDQYLLCYFLGAAELGIACLSFFGSAIKDKQALRLIATTLIVFHIATGALELYALTQGISNKIVLTSFFVSASQFYFYIMAFTKIKYLKYGRQGDQNCLSL